MGGHFIFLITIVFLSTTLPQSYSQKNNTYSTCNQPFSCGTLKITNISFPFCGSDGFNLTCMHNQNTSIQVGSQKFNVLNINQTASTMRMVRTDLVYDSCSSNLTNTSLKGTPFSFLPTVHNVTLFYECPSDSSTSAMGTNFTCQNDSSNKHAFYVVNGTQEFQNCGVSIQVQVSKDVVWDSESESGVGKLKKVLDQGFDVKYGAGWSSQCKVCRESGGTCGTNGNDSDNFSCYCSGGRTHAAAVCPAHKSMQCTTLSSLSHFVGFNFNCLVTDIYYIYFLYDSQPFY